MKNDVIALDQKDRRILYELDRNARISFVQLGKHVGLSPEVVNYRVKKMEELGVIVQYQTSVNFKKMGLIHFKICLQFDGISTTMEENIYKLFDRIPQIMWIVKCRGEWDCILSCTVNSIDEFDKIKDKIVNIAHNHINKKSISLSNGVFAFPRNYMVEKTERVLEKPRTTAVDLDETNLKILRILSKNARKSSKDIAKELVLTVKTSASRIKKLLKSGIINNFRLVINYEKLGIHFYKTFFYLKNPDEKRFALLMARLNENPNVILNMKVIGEWDLEPEFEFYSEIEFQATIQKILNDFSDIIQRISVIDIVKEHKFTYFYK